MVNNDFSRGSLDGRIMHMVSQQLDARMRRKSHTPAKQASMELTDALLRDAQSLHGCNAAAAAALRLSRAKPQQLKSFRMSTSLLLLPPSDQVATYRKQQRGPACCCCQPTTVAQLILNTCTLLQPTPFLSHNVIAAVLLLLLLLQSSPLLLLLA